MNDVDKYPKQFTKPLCKSPILFSNGKANGQGHIVYYTNDKKGRYNYTGSFNNGLRHGKGNETSVPSYARKVPNWKYYFA